MKNKQNDDKSVISKSDAIFLDIKKATGNFETVDVDKLFIAT